MRLRVELDVIFEKYVHVTQLGTNLKKCNHLRQFYIFSQNWYGNETHKSEQNLG